VKKRFPFAIFLAFAGAWNFTAWAPAHSAAQSQSSSQEQSQQTAPPQPQQQPSSTPPTQTTPSVSAARPTVGPVVVLDPAHGGTDTGARGENNVTEKDIVLAFAREAKGELESQGFRVVLTRNDDSNPSYDDRAAAANAFRDAVFISIHVASTGTVGTAHTYFYQFWSAFSSASPATTSPTSAAPGLTTWEEAQRPYADKSRKFADILQSELATRFSGSPTTATGIAVRGLRSVQAPAAAIELSSITVSDPSSLTAMAAPLATSIVHAVQTYHPAGTPVTP
jgi:N-acetylmuramoyl-L-alanine amidase